MLIAIDFDGTCVTHEYPHIGKDIGAIPVLKSIVECGHHLLLNTMRSGSTLSEALKWFTVNDIKLHGINEAPGQKHWTDSPKVYAELYIDDAALGAPLNYDEPRPYINWEQVARILSEMEIIP
jgi:hypothetical protein